MNVGTQVNWAGGHVVHMPVVQSIFRRHNVCAHIDMPVPQVVGLRVEGHWSTGVWRQILEQLNSKAGLRAQ